LVSQITLEEAIEKTKVHSIAGLLRPKQALVAARPFRAPHHTISDAGLIGGTAEPRPGEVCLAHNGVLFLDELPEFKRNALEVMRQPLEDGRVTIARAASSMTFPCRFMLVAAMNPTPTGSADSRSSPAQVQKYLNKISSPLLDRIDIHVEVPALKYEEMRHGSNGESSADIRSRVVGARKIQSERFKAAKKIRSNAQMGPKEVKAHCGLDAECEMLLRAAMDQLALSARGHDRILKVARTIADLAGSEKIAPDHLAEAVQYRSLDRTYWV
jgi:magnesium chelatase family protein